MIYSVSSYFPIFAVLFVEADNTTQTVASTSQAPNHAIPSTSITSDGDHSNFDEDLVVPLSHTSRATKVAGHSVSSFLEIAPGRTR